MEVVNSELVEGPPVTEATAYTFIEPMYLMFSRSLAQSFVMIKDLQFSILWRDRENRIQSYEVFDVDDPPRSGNHRAYASKHEERLL